ncbi:MAG TPA: type VI secretion system baseplate subunit TssF [Polyangiaceae bacterium]|jgi:type VI secretion system protein ImpG|nr:type VI secretion system baseplate subunit TssF [Polyangiaceae bacterium]
MIASEVLKDYFLRELAALREGATRFAQDFPVVAGQLALQGGRSKDPQVELLLQSFAFLTGQLRHAMDVQDATLPGQLLEALNPQLACPLPAMAVLQVAIGGGDANFALRNSLPAHTEMATQARWKGAEQRCRFRTMEPLELWPIEVTAVEPCPLQELPPRLVPQGTMAALRLRLSSLGPAFHEMPITSLRFFLDGPYRYELYDALSGSLLAVISAGPGAAGARLVTPARGQPGTPGLSAVEEEEVEAPAHPGLARLREYFACPERFLFHSVDGLSLQGQGSELELIWLFSSACPPVRREDVRLNCVPIANLYRQRVEPLVLRAGRVEYPLVGDRQRHGTCEIHSLRSLSLREPSGRECPLGPLYGSALQAEAAEAFWSLRREVSQLPSVPGTESWVSFVDRDFLPGLKEGSTVGGSAWCTDRRLPESLEVGARMRLAPGAVAREGVLLTQPSLTQAPALSGDGVRRLCAQLSDHCLPLSGGADSLARLKEVLAQHFEPHDARARQQLAGLTRLSHARVAERTGQEAWHGLSVGVKLTLTVDRSAYRESSALLFGDVLSECFAGFAPLNGFVRLEMVGARGELLKLWPARSRMGAG